MRSLAFAAVLLIGSLPLSTAGASGTTVRVHPDTVWIERGRGEQLISCDFEFGSEATDTLEITHVDVRALDARGRLLAAKFLGSNGTAPSILTLPKRTVTRGEPLLVFNPFPEWTDDLPIATLAFAFTLETASRAETVTVDVRPHPFVQHTRLVLPITGRVFVFDAHDPLAHHRRLDTTFAPIAKLGLHHNSGRYAYDLSLVDEKGSMVRTDGAANADWWSWNVPVRAPGAGRVVKVFDDREDWEVGKTGLSLDAILADASTLFGNSVVIDHGNGEYSLVAHMRRGSVRVKEGAVVRLGDPLGAIGYSGSVFTVHVHYELRCGVGLDVDGLPSRFAGVDRWIGGRRQPVKDGFVTTGDVLESR